MANTGITNNIAFLRLVTMVVSDVAASTAGHVREDAKQSLHAEVRRRVTNYANYCDLNDAACAAMVTKAIAMVDVMCALSTFDLDHAIIV